MPKTVLASAAAAAWLALASPAHAQSPGVDFTATNPIYMWNPSAFSLGYEFAATANVSVTGLAAWDSNGSGFNNYLPGTSTPVSYGTQQVGLWDANGNLLASAYVTPTSALLGSAPWRWASIAPITLTAGQDYYVASQGGAEYAWETAGLTVDPSITFIEAAYASTGSASDNPLEFPGALAGDLPAAAGGGYFGGNIVLGSAIPEPATLSILGIGLLGFGLVRRRRP